MLSLERKRLMTALTRAISIGDDLGLLLWSARLQQCSPQNLESEVHVSNTKFTLVITSLMLFEHASRSCPLLKCDVVCICTFPPARPISCIVGLQSMSNIKRLCMDKLVGLSITSNHVRTRVRDGTSCFLASLTIVYRTSVASAMSIHAKIEIPRIRSTENASVST